MFLHCIFTSAAYKSFFANLFDSARPGNGHSLCDQTSVCQQPSLMFETCECKHTPTRGGTMHASLQTANRREAASLVVVHSLNFSMRKWASVFCVHVFAIGMSCSIKPRLSNAANHNFPVCCKNVTLHSLD